MGKRSFIGTFFSKLFSLIRKLFTGRCTPELPIFTAASKVTNINRKKIRLNHYSPTSMRALLVAARRKQRD